MPAAFRAVAALPAPDYFFYDDRFPAARRLAARIAPDTRLTPVQGDLTAYWNAELARACAAAPRTFRGVTTESFYFCLRVMAGAPGRIAYSSTRVGRDLLLWRVRSGIEPAAGAIA